MSSSVPSFNLECLLNNNVSDFVWSQFAKGYYQYWKLKIIALSPTQHWGALEDGKQEDGMDIGRGGLASKFHKIACQVKTALVDLVSSYDPDQDEFWIVDSGASHHAVKNKALLQNPIPCRQRDYVTTKSLPNNASGNMLYLHYINMTGVIVRLLSCLVSKLKDLTNAWQSIHTALADIVLDYEFEKLQEDDSVWIVDSGASRHAVRNKNLLHKPIPLLPKRAKGFCGETRSRATHIGHAYLPVKMNPEKAIRLREVIRFEYISNLLSVSQLTADFPMLSFEFYSTGFLLKNVKTKRVLVEGPQIGDIYFWPSPKVDAWRARANGSCLGNLMIKPSVIIKALWELMIVDYLGSLVALLMYKMQMNALWALIFRGNNNLQRKVGDLWVVDSGAANHSSFDPTLLRNSTKVGVKNLESALDVGGRRAAITHIGDVYLPTQRPGREILIHGVELIPKSIVHILSVSAMTSQFSCCFKFGSNGFVMKSLDTNKVIAKGRKRDKLYYWGNNVIDFRRDTKPVEKN